MASSPPEPHRKPKIPTKFARVTKLARANETEKKQSVDPIAGLLTSQRKTLTTAPCRSASQTVPLPFKSNISSSPSVYLLTRHFSVESADSVVKKRVEDVMPIATGHEREELEVELQGKKILEDVNNPVGPFGTKGASAFVKYYNDKRIVGCPGGEGEDEHDVVWYWLEKGQPHECPVCSQYFVLKVVGPGGPPDGQGDDDHHH